MRHAERDKPPAEPKGNRSWEYPQSGDGPAIPRSRSPTEAPTLAAGALKSWRRYHEVHTALAASDTYAVDQYEDNELPGVAAALAEALAALLD